MRIEVPPPQLILLAVIGIPALMLMVALLLRGRPLAHRLAPIIIGVVTGGAVLYFGYRPLVFSWDASGIRDEAFREPITLSWSAMQDVRCVRGFRATPLRLQLRTAGTAYAGNASGNFRLADGGSARVFVEAGATDALLIQASGARYLYAPRSFEPFLAEARRSHPGGVRDGRQPGR